MDILGVALIQLARDCVCEAGVDKVVAVHKLLSVVEKSDFLDPLIRVEIVNYGLVPEVDLEQVIVIIHLVAALDATLDVPVGAARHVVEVEVLIVGILHPLFKVNHLPFRTLERATKL